MPKAQKVDWRVVWAAAAAMLVEGYDLGVYGNLLPFLLKDGTLGMDTALAGVAGSAVFIGMLLGGLAAGWLNSRYGQRSWSATPTSTTPGRSGSPPRATR